MTLNCRASGRVKSDEAYEMFLDEADNDSSGEDEEDLEENSRTDAREQAVRARRRRRALPRQAASAAPFPATCQSSVGVGRVAERRQHARHQYKRAHHRPRSQAASVVFKYKKK